jgi:predicted phosphohydrolase
MKIWAIADLHLGFSTGKWMDVFGEHWRGHHLKVEASWKELIEAQDIVLLPGDFSWAMKAEEAVVDLRWLAALPGRKVLIKGNHDYWWPGTNKKMNDILPPGVHAIKKKAITLDGVPIVGVRGGDFFMRDSETPQEVEGRLKRERGELLQSIGDLERTGPGACRPIALFHYPPFPVGRSESFFTRIVEEAGCSTCLFGHLHSEPEWNRVFQGELRGVRYHLVSCDYLGFRPRLVAEL